MDLLTKIKQTADENGMVLFGTSDVHNALPPELSDMPFAVTIGMRYPKAVIRAIKGGPTPEYFHQYRTMNANLDRTALLIQTQLLRVGYEAMYIPASQSIPGDGFRGLLSHKIAAVKSGLGFIGKNNLFISTAYGSAVRLSTVLTDMILPKGVPVQTACGNCRVCADVCPSGAIFGIAPKPPYRTTDIFSPEKCAHHLKTAYQHIGRGSVCGICIANCPFNRL